MHQDFQWWKAECLRHSRAQQVVPRLLYYPTEKDMWTGPVHMVIDALMTHMLPSFHLDIANFGGEDLSKGMWRMRF